ncbi:MAG: hypothetical protein P8074_08290 [Anaerolineales bacterium]|jgi:hypothetical protein
MVESISRSLHRLSSGWLSLIAFMIFVLFTALVLPAQAAEADANSGGAGSPDTSFFYSAADLYQYAETYGESGRQAYVRARFTFDLVWPLVYTFFLLTSISWTFRWAFPAQSLWQRANLAPLLGLLFDYLENISTSLVMLRYPQTTPILDVLAPVFTGLKWLFVIGSFVLLLVGGIAALRVWITRRTSLS